MRTGERSINNALFSISSVVLPGAVILLLLPYIERTLGAAGYGIYTLVVTVIGYFAVLDLGLGSAVTKYTAEYNAQKNAEGIGRLIGSSILLLLLIGAAGALIMAGCAKLLATRVLHIPAAYQETAFLAFCAGGLGFLFSMQFTLASAVLNGLNRYDISGAVTTGMGLLTTIGTAILLSLGLRLLSVVLLNVGITLAATILSAAMIKRVFPSVSLLPAFDKHQLGRVTGFGAFTLLSRVSDLIVHQLDVIIIGVILDVSWVTYYIIPLRMVLTFAAITARIANVGFPVISEFQGRNDWEGAVRFYVVLSRIIMVVATSFSIPAIVLGPQFLKIWMGAAFAEKSGATLGLLAAGVYLVVLTNVPTSLVNGLGKPKVSGIAAALTGALFLALMVPLGQKFGVSGVALAYLLTNAFMTPLFVLYVNRRILRLPVRAFMSKVMLRPLLAGVPVGGALLLLNGMHIGKLSYLILVGIGSVIAYLGMCKILGGIGSEEIRAMRVYWRLVRSKLVGWAFRGVGDRM